jgi:hypothetical protein
MEENVFPELTEEVRDRFIKAAPLHDVGKIKIPDQILNKPGKYESWEYDIMKGHAAYGGQIIYDIMGEVEEPEYLEVAHDVAMYHHERWDGTGYPAGLKGDEIPLCARIMAIADVYDALTSERCYKHAFTHEKALEMIHNNECGVFNPVLIECLDAIADKLVVSLQTFDWSKQADKDFFYIADAMMNDHKYPIYNQAFRQFIDERKKSHFYESMINGILFEYTYSPSVIKLSPKASQLLGLPKTIVDEDGNIGSLAHDATADENLLKIRKILHRKTAPKDKPVLIKQTFNIDGKSTPCTVRLLQIWNQSAKENPVLESAYGHIDISH